MTKDVETDMELEEPWRTMLHFCARPRMYVDTESFAEVLIFLQGVAVGAAPPHGCLRMGDFVAEKFGADRNRPWSDTVAREFAELDFSQACASLGSLIAEFRELEQNG